MGRENVVRMKTGEESGPGNIEVREIDIDHRVEEPLLMDFRLGADS